ncbi:hypothetical protein Strain138_000954 [Pseudogemmatithrix spongiicola]|uniref:Uncharacterized protein n=1 Tax=Pseudogemmatithrix spongiicola TaxID=3062599 RepID=A0AA49Q4B4_9BACT|nr:hypothetical protein Strain138_000954 [Gemmatimonadaceae bacterium 'strain 138']WKW14606.1 hypothetical protein Strain318_000954 [Gemmatimonadaceae bacterium 'strain 318']
MTDRDWDAELKKIDAEMAKQASRPAPAPSRAPAAPSAPSGGGASAGVAGGMPGFGAPAAPATSSFGVYARLTLAVAIGVGIIFWPYANRCGLGLAGYLGAVSAVVVSGAWSAVWTFRHRAGRAHVLSLLLVLWGLILASLDVLPRIGYAKPTVEHPAAWACE